MSASPIVTVYTRLCFNPYFVISGIVVNYRQSVYKNIMIIYCLVHFPLVTSSDATGKITFHSVQAKRSSAKNCTSIDQ